MVKYDTLAEAGKMAADYNREKKLEKVEDLEGCPHLEPIIKSVRDMSPTGKCMLKVSKERGTAWFATDNKYYWHPQDDFKPLTAQLVYRRDPKTGRVKEYRRPFDGTNCRLCLQAIKKRE